jgi:aldose 1-epimerase
MKQLALLLVVFSLAASAANYTAQQTTRDGVEVVVLTDAARHTVVTLVPSAGNATYEMKVNGKDVLRTPVGNLAEFKKKPGSNGIPFLAPWANRIDSPFFYANGKKYNFNLDLKNVSLGRNKFPIHGLLGNSSAWRVAAVKADRRAAEVTSRLEFYKYPDLMAQFPFAHTIEITHRLSDGVLEVETVLINHSTEPMPNAIGFHSYFRVNDAPPDQWKLHVGARDHWVLSPELIPTGERKPVSYADPLPLAGVTFDDVFSNLVRGADGRGEFWLQGKTEKVSVIFGPKYDVAVIYFGGRDNIAIETMTAITNGYNMAHAGTYKELQSVPPGGQWRESFWIKPTGF